MHSTISTAALAMLLASTQAAPALPAIVPDVSLIPTSAKDLASWAAAHGLGFDPSYVHIPSPDQVANVPHVSPDTSILTHALSPSFGSLPTVTVPNLAPRYTTADTRYQYTNSKAFPWRSVGQIQWSNGVFCTGQLIGPRHVLTAKHCVPQDKSQNISVTFAPSYDRGPNPTFGKANVVNSTYVTTPPPSGNSCDTRQDSAVFLIDKRLGDTLGYFGVEIPDTSSFNQKIFTTLGYPGDKDNGQRPYRVDGSMLSNPNDPPQFSCDQATRAPIWSDTTTAGGQSGSALWKGNGTVWGVLSVGVYWGDKNFASGWASGDYLVNLITSARNTWR